MKKVSKSMNKWLRKNNWIKKMSLYKVFSNLMQAKIGNIESLLTSKDAKIQELKGQIDDQKQEMNHSSSHQSSLGGQLTALR